jgi:hypothetical protein
MTVPGVLLTRSGYGHLVHMGQPCHIRSRVTNAPGRSFTDWKHQDEGWQA